MYKHSERGFAFACAEGLLRALHLLAKCTTIRAMPPAQKGALTFICKYICMSYLLRKVESDHFYFHVAYYDILCGELSSKWEVVNISGF
jgi:hypothetical protein